MWLVANATVVSRKFRWYFHMGPSILPGHFPSFPILLSLFHREMGDDLTPSTCSYDQSPPSAGADFCSGVHAPVQTRSSTCVKSPGKMQFTSPPFCSTRLLPLLYWIFHINMKTCSFYLKKKIPPHWLSFLLPALAEGTVLASLGAASSSWTPSLPC